MRDHWPVCTQYMVVPLIVYPFEDSWHVRNGTSSNGNSRDEVFFYFHNGFIHQVTWLHMSVFLPLGAQWGSWCMKPLGKQKKTSSLELSWRQCVDPLVGKQGSQGHERQPSVAAHNIWEALYMKEYEKFGNFMTLKRRERILQLDHAPGYSTRDMTQHFHIPFCFSAMITSI